VSLRPASRPDAKTVCAEHEKPVARRPAALAGFEGRELLRDGLTTLDAATIAALAGSGAWACRLRHLSALDPAAERAEGFGRPIVAIRVLTWLLVALLVTAICLVVAATGLRWGRVEITEIIQTSEAGLSEAVLIGAGLLFLIGWERRLKRSRALRALHELRSVAHVIDMHQLTKDPERLLERYSSTKASPRETMTAFELNRYLDYCSELLSLTG
jgi:hypothetical protein